MAIPYRLIELDRRLHAAIADELRASVPRSTRLLRLKLLRLAIRARLASALRPATAG